ncbi:unnamed protein product [Penicillium olsonii]|nr:unnamed protein product [Penicillium olsonii]CAG7934262.1 unnamed protein product [Penicillium olsonii]
MATPASWLSLRGASDLTRRLGLSMREQEDAAEPLRTEATLMKSGETYALQLLRYHTHCTQISQDGSPNAVLDLLITEEELREVVQEEMATKSASALDSDAKQRLKGLERRYHVLSRKWWIYRQCLGKGFQGRAFELWRSHPRWYMHKELVEDCAGLQGCCSRGCGCCLNRKIDASRSLGVGHCTVECGCCTRARGFEFSDSEKDEMDEVFEPDDKDTPGYSNRSAWLRLVSIWGLSTVSRESPFEMIDIPPSYEESQNSNWKGKAVKR